MCPAPGRSSLVFLDALMAALIPGPGAGCGSPSAWPRGWAHNVLNQSIVPTPGHGDCFRGEAMTQSGPVRYILGTFAELEKGALLLFLVLWAHKPGAVHNPWTTQNKPCLRRNAPEEGGDGERTDPESIG